MRRAAAATLPPAGLPGLDPDWSRLVRAVGPDGQAHTWHLLDTGAEDDCIGTILCVHGNPTWSYLWRRVLEQRPAGWRVIAVDQLGMGYSERLQSARTLAQRVDDLQALTTELGLTGPVVTLAHDWGGIIALGWALRQRLPVSSQIELSAIVLTNTAVHQPSGSPAPALIRAAGAPVARQLLCQYLPAFLRATTRLSRPALPVGIRNAFAAPYRTASRRAAIADFVADIPLDDSHVSASTLASIADQLPLLADLPVLLLWGPRDPVFSDLYLRDLLVRFPNADVHRYEGASHLVLEDRPGGAAVIADWVGRLASERSNVQPPGADVPPGAGVPPIAGVPHSAAVPHSAPAKVAVSTTRARADELAVLQLDGRPTRLSFAALEQAVDTTARQLSERGVAARSRVALLIPPGIDLTVAAYACWQIGAIVVVADAGLGLRGMGRALRGAGPDFVLGSGRGVLAARLMRLPGAVLVVGSPPLAAALSATFVRTSELLYRVASVQASISPTGHTDLGSDADPSSHTGSTRRAGLPPLSPQESQDDCDAAVVFTSGATGPAKGVLYRQSQLIAQVELLRRTYDIGPDDRLVAAFAPFALYAPALGIASVVPRMKVTAPATLTAAALADAIDAAEATLVFAAPAALRNVVATQDQLTDRQRSALSRPRLVLSAGAPVPVSLQRAVAALMPHAEVHTPYGMTEALPISDVQLSELTADSPYRGVCVGRPLAGVSIGISVLDQLGNAVEPPSDLRDVVGEICVSAAHVKDHYDRLWATESQSSRDAGWHRTGDVGMLDSDGRLWVQGRLRDVVSTPEGPVTPVPLELLLEQLASIEAAAVVGVGPVGSQHPVVVAVPRLLADGPRTGAGVWATRMQRPRPNRLALAPPELAAAVRAGMGGEAGMGAEIAAVVWAAELPVDIRHNSKIDRARLARDVTALLSGHVPRLRRLVRPGRLLGHRPPSGPPGHSG